MGSSCNAPQGVVDEALHAWHDKLFIHPSAEQSYAAIKEFSADGEHQDHNASLKRTARD